jgi:hypothetical protein
MLACSVMSGAGPSDYIRAKVPALRHAYAMAAPAASVATTPRHVTRTPRDAHQSAAAETPLTQTTLNKRHGNAAAKMPRTQTPLQKSQVRKCHWTNAMESPMHL